MSTVWIAFEITAAFMAGSAWLMMRSKGEQAQVSRNVGRYLLLMAVGTACFPALLPLLGVQVWAGSYFVFVALTTGILTATTVKKAKQVACRWK